MKSDMPIFKSIEIIEKRISEKLTVGSIAGKNSPKAVRRHRISRQCIVIFHSGRD
jgi:RNase P protein component